MKILYIAMNNMFESSGVVYKIQGQVRAMNTQSLKTDVIYPTKTTINLTDLDNVRVLSKYIRLPLIGFFSATKQLYLAAWDLIKEEDYDGVFIRYSIADWNLMKFFNKLKTRKIKIFLEIPSFPYDKEYSKKFFIKRFLLLIDKYYRKNFSKYVDYCFTPSKVADDIYGMKTIFFDNAVEPQMITERRYAGSKLKILRIIGVANLASWHGYDRIIKGIKQYYDSNGEKMIRFNIVGEGKELKYLKSLTKTLNLENDIIFHGKKFNVELDKVYNNSDIGVAAIGMHRLDFSNISSLKSREYCLKSLPFISSRGDKDFLKNFDYVFHIENNEKPVDIFKVVEFFEKIKDRNYIKEMRKYGEENLSWDKKFAKVIKTIKLCH